MSSDQARNISNDLGTRLEEYDCICDEVHSSLELLKNIYLSKQNENNHNTANSTQLSDALAYSASMLS